MTMRTWLRRVVVPRPQARPFSAHSGLLVDVPVTVDFGESAKLAFAPEWLLRPPTGRPFSVAGGPDPYELVAPELRALGDSMKSLVRDAGGGNHPVLIAAAEYYFNRDGGKQLRPTMVMLMAAASNAENLDVPLKMGTSLIAHERWFEAVAREPWFASQRRLAEIAEMVHTASLFHYNVINSGARAASGGGGPSVGKTFGNKVAVLAGDFLLARASLSLALMRDVAAFELVSRVIEDLARSETMRPNLPPPPAAAPSASSPPRTPILGAIAAVAAGAAAVPVSDGRGRVRRAAAAATAAVVSATATVATTMATTATHVRHARGDDASVSGSDDKYAERVMDASMEVRPLSVVQSVLPRFRSISPLASPPSRV